MAESFFSLVFLKNSFGKDAYGGGGLEGRAKERDGYVLVIKPQLNTKIGDLPWWFSHNPKNPL
jgi:hypothetical protein